MAIVEDESNDDDLSIDLGKLAFWKNKKQERKNPDTSSSGSVGSTAAPSSTEKKESPSARPPVHHAHIAPEHPPQKGAAPSSASAAPVSARPPAKADDDDLAIDFSGIGKLFSRKQKTGKQTASARASKDASPRTHTSGDDEDLGFNVSGAFDLVKKYRAIILIIFAVAFMFHFRNFPNDLPITDRWAHDAVFNNYRSQIRAGVDQQYPSLPDANKNAIVEQQLTQFYGQNKDAVDQQVAQVSQQFKQHFKNDQGYTYLADIDSYFWLRQAENILDHGHVGDTIKDGALWDNLMTAPHGSSTSPSLYPYAEAYLYRIFKTFHSSITTMQAAFLTPWVFGILSIIAVFFLTRRIAGDFGATIAAIYIGIHPFILSRTFGSDNDIVNVVFPVLALWLFMEAFEANTPRTRTIYSILTGLAFGMYSFAWGGWWFVFDFIIVTVLGYLLYTWINYIWRRPEFRASLRAQGIALIVSEGIAVLLWWALRGWPHGLFIWMLVLALGLFLYLCYQSGWAKKTLRKNILKEFFQDPSVKSVVLTFGLVFVSTIIFTGLFMRNFKLWLQAFLGPFAFLSIKNATQATIWPNVYTTVAELNPVGNLQQIINTLGTPFLFYLSILGVILLLFTRDIRGQRDVKFAILFVVWYLGIIYSTFSGVRFILMLVPAYVIGVGIATGLLHRYGTSWMSKQFSINKTLVSVVLIVGLSLVLIKPLQAASANSLGEIPIINDAWWNALSKIRMESEPTAIVNSWWDFGHHFKYITQRGVTFDGASQSTPMAHWIGRVLLTDNEDEAMGILRMLDCNSDETGNFLEETYGDGLKAVDTLKKTILMDKEDAHQYLLGTGLSEADAQVVLAGTHCEPPENYFITSEDMIGKSGVWGHFGSWNFTRSAMVNAVAGLKKDAGVKALIDKGLVSDAVDAERLYFEITSLPNEESINQWIAPWPGFQGGAQGCNPQGDMLICGPVAINTTSNTALVGTQQGMVIPQVYVYPDEQGVQVKTSNSSMSIGVTLIPTGNNEFMVTLASPETAKSIFTRLFFLKGHGLSHFKPFTYERSIIGNEIYVWKVDWEGKEKNIVYSLDQPAQDETAMNATESTADGNADNGTSSGSAADTTANSTEASAGLAGTVG